MAQARRRWKKKRRTTSKRERVNAALELMHLGFRDYVGARTLLLAGLPVQGATLGSTAVEKYLKAFAATRGMFIRGHLKRGLVSVVRQYVPELIGALNPEFLSLLQRCYRLRYTDRLPAGFSIAVHSREVLAELDDVILRFENQLRITREPAGEPVLTPYKEALRTKSVHLCRENHCLLGQPKEEFLEGYNVLHTMMIRGGEEGILECVIAQRSPTDGHFERTGLRRATAEDFDGREPPPNTYKYGEGDREAAARAQMVQCVRPVRSFSFGGTVPNSTAQGALMKCAFQEGDPATYFLPPPICFHLRDSFGRALREHRFHYLEDARPEFLRSQPAITQADWEVGNDRQVIGCEFQGFWDGVVLVLTLHENGQERAWLHPTLAPVVLGYLREIIEAVGMVEPPESAADRQSY